jgi:hypothetical protein
MATAIVPAGTDKAIGIITASPSYSSHGSDSQMGMVQMPGIA